MASFSSSEGRPTPGGVVAAAAATAGVFALPRSVASLHTQHNQWFPSFFFPSFSFHASAHAATPAATLFTP
jgi:hypothetical protein